MRNTPNPTGIVLPISGSGFVTALTEGVFLLLNHPDKIQDLLLLTLRQLLHAAQRLFQGWLQRFGGEHDALVHHPYLQLSANRKTGFLQPLAF
jgi:hypothetical protein